MKAKVVIMKSWYDSTPLMHLDMHFDHMPLPKESVVLYGLSATQVKELEEKVGYVVFSVHSICSVPLVGGEGGGIVLVVSPQDNEMMVEALLLTGIIFKVEEKV